jgi:hypothetical protein
LEIGDPTNHRVNGEQVWGAKTLLSQTILTHTNEEMLTHTNNILTIFSDVKQSNASVIQPLNNNSLEPSVCKVGEDVPLTPPKKERGGIPSENYTSTQLLAPTVSIRFSEKSAHVGGVVSQNASMFVPQDQNSKKVQENYHFDPPAEVASA